MKNKDFKLLIEGFNKFLINEHMGHTAQCSRLFNSIPAEFQPYVNDTLSWYNGDAYTSEIDFGGDTNSEDDHNLLFEKVAEALGCLTYMQKKQVDCTILNKPSFKNMLVTYDDTLQDEIDYGTPSGPAASFGQYQPNPQVRSDDFLNSYKSKSNLCGSFEINGETLSGFYYQLGSTCGLEGQFKSSMSERSLKGLIFVAPDCSGGLHSQSQAKSEKRFKASLGGAWS